MHDLLKKEKKCALVTGGAGFIGSHAVDALLMAGWHVKVLDDMSSGSWDALSAFMKREKFSFIRGDISDREILRQAVSGADFVFHLAALVSVPLSVEKPEQCFRTNVSAFESLLQELRGTGAPLFYASSAAVYGDRSEGLRREDEAPRPLSPYGASKAMNEIQALAASNTWGIPAIGFRFFNVYGERQNPAGAYASVIPKFCAALAKGESPLIYGDGGQTRDFIYVRDLARILRDFIPLAGKFSGEVFNVASGKSVSLLDVLLRLKEISGCQAEERYLPERSDDIRHSRADLTKITAAADNYVTTDLNSGLKETFEWYRKNL